MDTLETAVKICSVLEFSISPNENKTEKPPKIAIEA
jgi:hypothetical protein